MPCGTWGHGLVVALAMLGEELHLMVSDRFSNLNNYVILYTCKEEFGILRTITAAGYRNIHPTKMVQRGSSGKPYLIEIPVLFCATEVSQN